MALDEVILRIGQFGKYQRRIYVILCLPVIICAFHKIGGSFIAYEVKSRCVLPHESLENLTYHIPENMWKEYYDRDDKKNSFNTCKIHPSRLLNVTENSTIISKAKKDLIDCPSRFIFDDKVFSSTVVTTWNLVCDKIYIKTISDSLFMVGVMIGSIILGSLSDKFGRRPIFFASLIIQLVGGVLVSISPSITLYIIFRMIVGASISGVFLSAYVMALEMVGPSKRHIAGVGCQLFFTFGYILLGGLAFLFRDWRILEIVITVPSIFFLTYWW